MNKRIKHGTEKKQQKNEETTKQKNILVLSWKTKQIDQERSEVKNRSSRKGKSEKHKNT